MLSNRSFKPKPLWCNVKCREAPDSLAEVQQAPFSPLVPIWLIVPDMLEHVSEVLFLGQ